jgi:hypothetical protein
METRISATAAEKTLLLTADEIFAHKRIDQPVPRRARRIAVNFSCLRGQIVKRLATGITRRMTEFFFYGD